MSIFSLLQSAEHTAERLPHIVLEAQRVAAALMQGVHGRRQAGLGDAFWQFRDYQSHDRMMDIDWRQSAKGDRLFVREREWEAVQTLWLWCDAGPRMDYASSKGQSTKREVAQTLSLALGFAMLKAGERVGFLGLDRAPVGQAAQLPQMAARLLGLDQAMTPTALAAEMLRLRRYAQIVMVGDFLDDLAKTQAMLSQLASRRVGVQLVQVLDQAELSLPFAGRVQFEGVGTQAREDIQEVQSVRQAYMQRVRAHCQGLQDLCRAYHAGYVMHITHEPMVRTCLSVLDKMRKAG